MSDAVNDGGPGKESQCRLCGYTKEDAQLHMDHKICRARGGSIPGYDDNVPATQPIDSSVPERWVLDLAMQIYSKSAELDQARQQGDRITLMDEIAAYVAIINDAMLKARAK